jgi:acetylornithine deacetylase/succinyl-diaminopimelate desuccinylase-like protein
MHTTCVATMMSAGHAANALPQRASANVNCRILPGHTADEVRAVLVKVVDDPKVTITAVNNGRVLTEAETTKASLPPPPLNAALFGADGHGGALGEAVQTMWPGLPIVPQMSAGASDSKYTNAAGIPSYGIGGEAVDLDDDREHGKDERLRVESYYGGVEFYYLLLKDLTE